MKFRPIDELHAIYPYAVPHIGPANPEKGTWKWNLIMEWVYKQTFPNWNMSLNCQMHIISENDTWCPTGMCVIIICPL